MKEVYHGVLLVSLVFWILYISYEIIPKMLQMVPSSDKVLVIDLVTVQQLIVSVFLLLFFSFQKLSMK